jgi:hypothetical protein
MMSILVSVSFGPKLGIGLSAIRHGSTNTADLMMLDILHSLLFEQLTFQLFSAITLYT